MDVVKVSVIVPAYNAGKFLERCLDSLAAQTLQAFEVLVVDDGSKDETGPIADAYAQKDPRFRVIHQENKGVSAARQAGMDACTGQFSIHVDADDWVEPDMLEQLYRYAQEREADMVICDFQVHFPEGKTEIWPQDPGSEDHWVVLGKTFHDLYGSLCNKLVRRSCYLDRKLRMDESLYACEDQAFVLSLLTQPLRIAYLGKALYHYDRTQNAASLVNGNPLIKERLHVLEAVSAAYDLTPVQEPYDKAVMHLAYDSLFYPSVDSPALFRKHRGSILRAKGFPARVKVLTLLGIYGIPLPMSRIRQARQRTK